MYTCNVIVYAPLLTAKSPTVLLSSSLDNHTFVILLLTSSTAPEVLEQMLLSIYGARLVGFDLKRLKAADMYGLEGMKSCLIGYLRRDHCHLFQKDTVGAA